MFLVVLENKPSVVYFAKEYANEYGNAKEYGNFIRNITDFVRNITKF